jgi:hypothetical protein
MWKVALYVGVYVLVLVVVLWGFSNMKKKDGNHEEHRTNLKK